MLKRAKYTEVLHVRVEREIAEDWRILRAQHGVDSNELVRVFLRDAFKKIKKKFDNQAS